MPGGGQRGQLAPDRAEAPRLDFHQQAVLHQVDHVAIDHGLRQRAGRGVPRLKRGMERRFVERADGR